MQARIRREGYPFDLAWEAPPSNVTVKSAETGEVLRIESPEGKILIRFKNGKKKRNKRG